MTSDLRQQIQRAKQAFERHEYAAALTDFQAILSRNARFADVRMYTGLCLSFLGHAEAALAEFDHAIALNPRYIEAYINRAITLNELGRFEEARQSFAQASALELDAQGPFPATASARIANAHASLGDLYREAGAWDQAAHQYKMALELRSHFHDIRLRYAQVLLQLHQPAEAADELRKVLDVNPRFTAARVDLGLAFFRLGHRDAAAREWIAVRQYEPNNAQVRAYLSMLGKHPD
jgi:tetratricopeptide (TPR) repeat protein